MRSIFSLVVILYIIVISLGLTLESADNKQTFRFVDSNKHHTLMKFFPQTNDPILNKIKNNSNIVFYTDREIPPAYQISDGTNPGVHSIFYNISAGMYRGRQYREPLGNANREFPWNVTAGLDWTNNGGSIKFYIPPENGPWIVWWSQRLTRDNGHYLDEYPTYQWMYLKGTIFGEILTVQDKEGYSYSFELRTRTKIGNKFEDDWQMNVYRPYLSWDELANNIRLLHPEREKWNQKIKDFFDYEYEEVRYTARNDHPTNVINRKANDIILPPLDHNLVKELLKEPFKSTKDGDWIPSTKSDFHIVPKNYATFLEMSNKKCMTCHDSVGKHANDFESLSQTGRDWYGRVRGSDAIFSFHIFDPSCISGNGMSIPVTLRRELINNGKLIHWNSWK